MNIKLYAVISAFVLSIILVSCSNITGEKNQLLYELNDEVSGIVQYNEDSGSIGIEDQEKINQAILRIGKILDRAKIISLQLKDKEKKQFDEEIARQLSRLYGSIQEPLYRELLKYKMQ
ncbi:MAG: hypothetical protein HPY53_08715 [Brevinematales bacterium]|nr:hypothetical protein [Brevinematales bacterium]